MANVGRVRRCIWCASVASLAAVHAAQASISIDSWKLSTLANETSNTPVLQSSVVIPFMQTDLSTDGLTSSQSHYDFDSDGTNATFHFDFDHGRGPAHGSTASSSGTIEFTIGGAGTYSFDGFYSSFGQLADLYLQVSLLYKDTNTTFFYNSQESHHAIGESFTVGQQNGNYANMLQGLQNGPLLPGSYVMSYMFSLSGAADDGGSASAAGPLDFVIQTVPEPATILLCFTGAAVALRRARRR